MASDPTIENADFLDEQDSSEQLATAWARYWSRLLDITIGLMAAGFLLGLVFPNTFLKLLDAVGGNDLLLFLIFLPVVFLADALWNAVLGQTLGRAIAGIRIQKKSGNRLSVSEALNRNAQVYVKGFGLGLPLVSLFTFANAHGKVKAGEETSWDDSCDTTVVAEAASLGRTTLTAVLYLMLVFAIQVWDKITEDTLNSNVPQQTEAIDSDPIEQQLRAAASELKASLPQELDSITSLVDIEVDGRVLTYVHEISRRDASDEDIQSFLDTTKLAEVCNNSEMRTLMDDFEVTYKYSYFMPNSSSPLTLTVNRAACFAVD